MISTTRLLWSLLIYQLSYVISTIDWLSGIKFYHPVLHLLIVIRYGLNPKVITLSDAYFISDHIKWCQLYNLSHKKTPTVLLHRVFWRTFQEQLSAIKTIWDNRKIMRMIINFDKQDIFFILQFLRDLRASILSFNWMFFSFIITFFSFGKQRPHQIWSYWPPRRKTNVKWHRKKVPFFLHHKGRRNFCPTDICPTDVCPTDVCPTDVPPWYVRPMYVRPMFVQTMFVRPMFVRPMFVRPMFVQPTYDQLTHVRLTRVRLTCVWQKYVLSMLVWRTLVWPQCLSNQHLSTHRLFNQCLSDQLLFDLTFVWPNFVHSKILLTWPNLT